ncbi:hypothetical protein GFY24_00930 [Nocardia sp. SYP-A9097]|uniref:WhiB family transcriptional regulator n=1 Tax=Nocardia sp. SYP-A9097 TaxID=2663237 RepID=UPI00129A207D|nr:WhiB family transcriptional regulator [Nocardia sp. SYP-A9097]MRH86041.1 hypothetical protein [Nocardia sp. SYP-A9097]
MTTTFDIPHGWHQSAACGQHKNPELWNAAVNSEDALEAKRICVSCPVCRACAFDAVRQGERRGIHGGFHLPTDAERRAMHAWLGIDPPKTGRKIEADQPAPAPAVVAGAVMMTCGCGTQFESESGRTVSKRGKLLRCYMCRNDLVPVGQVQPRVREVFEETGEYRATARQLGIGPEHVRNILVADKKYVKRSTAETILGIEIAKAS